MPRSRAPGPGKGGPRQGAPGQAYPNRSDLTQPGAAPQPASAPNTATMTPPRGYGSPSPAAPPVANAPSTPTAPVGQQTLPPQGMQGTPPPLDLKAPTQRPNEPVTAGVPAGPGPDSMPMPAAPTQDTLGLFLRELYRAQPSEDVRQLILNYEGQTNKAPLGPLPQQGPPQPSPPVAPMQPLAAPGKEHAPPPVGMQPPGLPNGS